MPLLLPTAPSRRPGASVAITCISQDVRALLVEALSPLPQGKPLLASLKGVPTCDEGHLGFGSAGGKKGRAPSARNIFMGQCIREERKSTGRPVPELMKLCSTRYKQQQGNA